MTIMLKTPYVKYQIAPKGIVKLSAGDVATLGLDVRQELLKAFAEGVKWRLTGPSPAPVFIPDSGPFNMPGASDMGHQPENYRGLLLLPAQAPQTAVNP